MVSQRLMTADWRAYTWTVLSSSNGLKLPSLGRCPRTGCNDYTCVRWKSNIYREIGQKHPLSTGCSDYACARCKSNSCKEMMQNSPSWTGCNDYTCARYKSDLYKGAIRSIFSICNALC